MGQIEVYQWLQKQRLMNKHAYFKYGEINKGLARDGVCDQTVGATRVNTNKLFADKYLDMKMTGKVFDWQRTFRLKHKFVKKRV